MFTAEQLRKQNIAEYLLYMWQIEDLIRANDCDIEKIKANVIPTYGVDADNSAKLTNWFADLIDMMRAEDVVKTGHLQINKNVIINLVDLHTMLLRSTKYPGYGAEFYRTLPFIVELRARAGENKSGEIETCFNALYGILLLRMQHKEISKQTLEAVTQITKFVSTLAHYYHKDKISPLFDKEDYDNL